MFGRMVLPAVRLLVVFTLLTGVLYPLLIAGIGAVVFPYQANGSLVTVEGQAVGSALVAQAFDDARYFQPRPSAIAYNPLPSGGTNLSPISAALAEQVAARRAALRESLGVADDAAIPLDLLFASGSGIDPHISPDAARAQVARVAQARGIDAQQVADLVERSVEPPQLGILGQPRVNVLLLNIALDQVGA